MSQTMHTKLFQFVLAEEVSQFVPKMRKVEVATLGIRDNDIFRLDTEFKKQFFLLQLPIFQHLHSAIV